MMSPPHPPDFSPDTVRRLALRFMVGAGQQVRGDKADRRQLHAHDDQKYAEEEEWSFRERGTECDPFKCQPCADD